MFGGMFGGLLGGLMLGGLIGMLMGHGLGGMAGMLGLIVQIALIGLVVMFAMRFFRSRQQPALAGGASNAPGRSDYAATDIGGGSSGHTSYSAAGQAYPGSEPVGDALLGEGTDELGITNEDLEQFEQLLTEIQAAFTREDYAGLRARCTPEIVSYLSEELSQNAVNGLRNEVLDVHLLQGDLAESWREGEEEYATVAMRYESIDVMRDRQTGNVVEGVQRPTETTEIWTFVRPVGGTWKLSAIQDMELV